MISASFVYRKLWQGVRWLAGCETPPSRPVTDDLEPYCDEDVLLKRMDTKSPLPTRTHKAIHKIGARYGAEL